MKLFDSIISTILSYNSEVWGAYIKHDFNEWDNLRIEKVNLKFCRLYLGVGRKANSIACRGELGKLPLIIKIHKQLFKYVVYLNLLPESKIAK